MKIRKIFFVPLFWLTLCCGFLLSFAWLALAGTYRDSAHGNSISRATIDPKYSSYGIGNCGHCHEQHASLQGSEPITVDGSPSQALAFNPAGKLCLTCHDGSPVPRDIKAQFAKTYRHPAGDISYAGRHTMTVLETGQNGVPFRDSSRHAECNDCHDPHTAQLGHQIFDTANPQNNNFVSKVLLNVWGVEPTSFSGNWTVPTSFTEQKPATKEYQICFKCHSYYALQASSGISTLTGPSGGVITDQAREVNPNNLSYHPVVAGTGNYPLITSRLGPPWNVNVGTQTMYCSDCHGDNDTSQPMGPHGSNNKFLLKSGTWPAKADGTLWKLSDRSNTALFCKMCHPLGGTNVGGTWGSRTWGSSSGADNSVHAKSQHQNYYCVNCHSAVPHGASRYRLIAFSSDPAPYDYNNNTAKMTSFNFSSSGSYSAGSCNASCGGPH
ncbi:MAG: hypothetical protein OEV89_08100 [Desulfobulbaceae bacterium]|nr:hypothetical protein [Desulfobulbaceae bacterium]